MSAQEQAHGTIPGESDGPVGVRGGLVGYLLMLMGVRIFILNFYPH